jgi:hypothetical protein
MRRTKGTIVVGLLLGWIGCSPEDRPPRQVPVSKEAPPASEEPAPVTVPPRAIATH